MLARKRLQDILGPSIPALVLNLYLPANSRGTRTIPFLSLKFFPREPHDSRDILHAPLSSKHSTHVQQFRGGLVFKLIDVLYHSSLGLKVIKKKTKKKPTTPQTLTLITHTPLPEPEPRRRAAQKILDSQKILGQIFVVAFT
jgi:hypothetical protein